MAIRPVNRIKHVFDSTASIIANTSLPVDIAVATDTADPLVATDVQVGAKVNGLYLRVEVATDDIATDAIPNVYMALYKSPANLAGNIQPNQVGASTNKRFVFHQEMVMLENSNGGNPRTLFNGVLAIPKGMRRFASADRLRMTILAPQVDIKLCVQAHYKEFR